MRIVAVADTHLFQLDLGELPPGDVFIHAGDLLRSGSEAELISVVPWLDSLPYRHKLVVGGNHDWIFARDRAHAQATLGPGIVYLEDAETTIDGVRFWGSPWQPEFNDWASQPAARGRSGREVGTDPRRHRRADHARPTARDWR